MRTFLTRFGIGSLSIAAGWICIAAELEPLPPVSPQVDIEYLKLVKWGQDLETVAQLWDATCQKPAPDTVAECADTKNRWDQEAERYLAEAKKYHTEGSDCNADIRQKIINLTIDSYTWDIKCVGGAKNATCDEEQLQLSVKKKLIDSDEQACIKQQDETL